MNERIGVVWNPSKIDASELRGAFEAAFTATRGQDLGQEATGVRAGGGSSEASSTALWFETSEDDPGRGATDDALEAGCTIVVAAGGDGTVRAVAERLGESGDPAAELGIVPLGTGNLLARNLEVPLSDTRDAFERVLTTTAAPLDLGVVRTRDAAGAGGRHGFVVMAGFGIDAQMIAETDDELKAKAGWLAYVESLGRAAATSDVLEFSLRLDEAEPRPEEAHTLLVANCGMIQGGITLLPDAVPDDGELDLLVLRAADAGSWLDTMKNMVWDNGVKRLVSGASEAESSSSTRHLRARRVSVELPHPRTFEIDGDDIGEVVEFEAQILPSALLVR